MNKKRFEFGDKIKVSKNYHWAQNATGKISETPIIFEKNSIDDLYWKENTLQGEKRFFWVVFDSPHFDADKDGPYSQAAIDSEYLEIIYSKNPSGL